MARTPLTGAPFPDGVQAQLRVRSKKKVSRNLSDKDIVVQHGNTSWVRVSSGVIVEGQENLAKDNVLQGGVLSKLTRGFDESGNNTSSYTFDPNLGFKPIPGITSVKTTAQSKTGATNTTDVSFKVNSLDQLNTFEKLYLRPGFYVLIEYGHSAYYDNNENIITNVPSVIDFFNSSKVEKINKRIKEIEEESSFNYAAQVGIITNYQYTYNKDGGYDCTIKVQSQGSTIEAFKATSTGTLPEKGTSVLDSLLEGNKKAEPAKEDKNSTSLEVLNFIYSSTGQKESLLQSMIEIFPSLNFENEDRPYYLHNITTDLPNSGKKVYITFSTLLKILNNTVNLVIDNDKELVKFGYNETSKDNVDNRFVTYDNHFSSDPNVCLLRKIPADKQLFFGAGDKGFPSATGPGDNINSDILLDVSYLARTLSTVVFDKNPDERTIVNFLKLVFADVQNSLGAINEFGFLYLDLPKDSDTPTLYIVDNNRTSTTFAAARNIIPSYGKGSVLRDLSLTSAITNKLKNVISIGATNTGANVGDVAAQTMKNFNKGISSRFVNKVDQAASNKVSAEKLKEANAIADKDYKSKIDTIKKAVELFVGGRSYKESEGKSLAELHSSIAILDTKRSSTVTQGLVPFEIAIEMQGISGISVHEVFKLQDGILPDSIQERFGFMVHGLSHNVQGNMWTTDITGAVVEVATAKTQKKPKVSDPVEISSKIQDKINNFTDKSS
jgi:hypothetical protein